MKTAMSTVWSNIEVPTCKIGKNHKWKRWRKDNNRDEIGVCLKCGYDLFDRKYKKVKTEE